MCLALPMKVIEIDENHLRGTVETGGSNLTVGLDLVPDVSVGDYVLVHAGMAIEQLEEDDARDILEACSISVFVGEPDDPGRTDIHE